MLHHSNHVNPRTVVENGRNARGGPKFGTGASFSVRNIGSRILRTGLVEVVGDNGIGKRKGEIGGLIRLHSHFALFPVHDTHFSSSWFHHPTVYTMSRWRFVTDELKSYSHYYSLPRPQPPEDKTQSDSFTGTNHRGESLPNATWLRRLDAGSLTHTLSENVRLDLNFVVGALLIHGPNLVDIAAQLDWQWPRQGMIRVGNLVRSVKFPLCDTRRAASFDFSLCGWMDTLNSPYPLGSASLHRCCEDLSCGELSKLADRLGLDLGTELSTTKHITPASTDILAVSLLSLLVMLLLSVVKYVES
ncbi:hypothetical protein DFH09DRAFT_1438989 [Mycena vulgaris]|nr:hypothetical protein DFH09DRAFT_1438989 [Mycena vulgaris]